MSTSTSYGGEIDIDGTAVGRFAFYAPSGTTTLKIVYAQGQNPITVSGMRDLPPSPATQDPGTTQTYTISNPETGALVIYQGTMSIEWDWLS